MAHTHVSFRLYTLVHKTAEKLSRNFAVFRLLNREVRVHMNVSTQLSVHILLVLLPSSLMSFLVGPFKSASHRLFLGKWIGMKGCISCNVTFPPSCQSNTFMHIIADLIVSQKQQVNDTRTAMNGVKWQTQFFHVTNE